MAVTVVLEDIVEALEMQFEEMPSFVDLETGQVHTVSRDEVRAAEEDEEGDEEQDEEWKLLRRIAFMDNVLALPDQFEVDERSIMEEFSKSVKNDRIRDELLRAIHGKGAFRHFKDTVKRHRIDQDWYDFRDAALRQIAIDWCEEHHLAWK